MPVRIFIQICICNIPSNILHRLHIWEVSWFSSNIRKPYIQTMRRVFVLPFLYHRACTWLNYASSWQSEIGVMCNSSWRDCVQFICYTGFLQTLEPKRVWYLTHLAAYTSQAMYWYCNCTTASVHKSWFWDMPTSGGSMLVKGLRESNFCILQAWDMSTSPLIIVKSPVEVRRVGGGKCKCFL